MDRGLPDDSTVDNAVALADPALVRPPDSSPANADTLPATPRRDLTDMLRRLGEPVDTPLRYQSR